MRVAVVEGTGAAPRIREVEHTGLRSGEVLVRIAGVGICHTDLTAIDGQLPLPWPMVLGHEGSGTVEAVGPEVRSVQVGDTVVLSFASCGGCRSCEGGRPAYCERFAPLNYSGSRSDGSTTLRAGEQEVHGSWFGQSSWGTHAVVDERGAVRIGVGASTDTYADDDGVGTADALPVHLLGPLGCGLLTGAGTVMNVLRPEPGQSIGFWGLGTVGLAGVMAARAAGCEQIVAVDLADNRLDLARELGATHTINPTTAEDVPRAVRKATGGLDLAMEAVGLGAVVRDALTSLRSPGVCATVGLQGFTNEIMIDQSHLLMGRTLTGVIEGDADPHELIPRLVDLWRAGRFPLERLITEYSFEDVATAVDDLRAGRVVKPVLRLRQDIP